MFIDHIPTQQAFQIVAIIKGRTSKLSHSAGWRFACQFAPSCPARSAPNHGTVPLPCMGELKHNAWVGCSTLELSLSGFFDLRAGHDTIELITSFSYCLSSSWLFFLMAAESKCPSWTKRFAWADRDLTFSV